jgi:tight adherence protein C
MPAVVLFAGLVGVALALLVVALAPASPAEGGMSRVVAAIEERYAQRTTPTGAEDGERLTPPPGWLRALALRLSPAGATAKIQRKLDIAGNPPRWDANRILAAKAAGLLALGALAGLYGLGALHNPGLVVAAMGAGAAVGFFLPDLLLYNTGVKRQVKIQQSLPDAMDMLTICVEAGLGFDAALARVTRNITGPLAAEFARSLQEMQIGKSRTEALRALAERTTVTELRAFVSALVQAGELGIPVAEVLREQAKEMRLQRRQRAEAKAQQVPVKILFPLIACLLPALFVIIIGPGGISIMHALFGGGRL